MKKNNSFTVLDGFKLGLGIVTVNILAQLALNAITAYLMSR